MFCSKCGHSVEQCFTYCPNCGSLINAPHASEGSQLTTKPADSPRPIVALPRPKPMTFAEFHSQKEQDRACNFKASKNKRKRKREEREDLDAMVKINFGIMLYNGLELKIQRGKTLQISIKKSANKDDLLMACLEKHKAHTSNIIQEGCEYFVLYPDGTKVDKLKENRTDEFILHKYREECGKDYQRITFYLTSLVDFTNATISSALMKKDSDSDAGDKIDSEAFMQSASHYSRYNKTMESFNCDDDSKEQPADAKNEDVETLLGIFPDVTRTHASAALYQSNFVMENAVENILSESEQHQRQQSLERVYSSFAFCNDIDNDFEFSEPCSSDLPYACLNDCNDKDTIDEGKTLQDCLIALSKESFHSDSTLRIKVRRSQVWEDAIFKLKKCSSKDFNKKMKIQFVGSPSPAYFAQPVADYIRFGKIGKVVANIADIPDAKIRLKLQNIEQIEDEERFKNVASFESSLRFKAGFTKPVVKMEDKASFMRSIALHYTLLFSMPEIGQFLEGLRLHGFLDTVRRYPQEARRLFTPVEQLTTEIVDAIFINQFSPDGSNKLADEESASLNFSRFLEEVEEGNVKVPLLDIETDTVSEITLNLPDVLQFITGSNQIPAVGFQEQPSIEFIHGDAGRKPYASTCTNTLYIPITNDSRYSNFKDNFGQCIIMSPGFGNV
eukprot:gene2036-2315_t